MGAANINALYQEFTTELPTIAAAAELRAEELEPLTAFNDWHVFVPSWLLWKAQESARRRPPS